MLITPEITPQPPPRSLQLSERYPDELKDLPNAITESTLDIFERHRADTVRTMLDRLVFHQDFS